MFDEVAGEDTGEGFEDFEDQANQGKQPLDHDDPLFYSCHFPLHGLLHGSFAVANLVMLPPIAYVVDTCITQLYVCLELCGWEVEYLAMQSGTRLCMSNKLVLQRF